MSRTTGLILSAVLLSALVVPSVLAQGPTKTADTLMAVTGSKLTYNPIEVPGFPSGMKLAAVSGDPNAASPYTLRLSFPAGYRFPPHWHPNVEHVTVLSGHLRLAMGERVDDAKLVTYGPGDYLYIPARHPHFGGAEGPTVIQLHGQGPFSITVVGQTP